MSAEPQVRLADRNEGLEVRTTSEVYRFNVLLKQGVWHVELPPSKGEAYLAHELSDAEEAAILPHVQRYLSRIYWLGFFPRSYQVRFDRDTHLI